MKKSSNLIYLKKKRFEKKYKKFITINKFSIIFIAVPMVISSILVLDNYFVKKKFDKKGLEYNPYINVNLNYINEREDEEFKDIKKYFKTKEKIKIYVDKNIIKSINTSTTFD